MEYEYVCPKCGGATKLLVRQETKTTIYARDECVNCGHRTLSILQKETVEKLSDWIARREKEE